MSKKISRREAIKDMLYAGVGLATAGTLLQACAPRGGAKAAAGAPFIPMPDAPEGSKVDSIYWDGLGCSIGMLGLGCMRLPSRPRSAGGGLDQDAVNEMVAESLNDAAASIQETIKAVTGKEVDKTAALEELIEAAESTLKEGGDE